MIPNRSNRTIKPMSNVRTYVHGVNNDRKLNQFETKIHVFILSTLCWILFCREHLGMDSVQLSVRDNEWKRPFIEMKRIHTHTNTYNENINYFLEPEENEKKWMYAFVRKILVSNYFRILLVIVRTGILPHSHIQC